MLSINAAQCACASQTANRITNHDSISARERAFVFIRFALSLRSLGEGGFVVTMDILAS
jgi:hypothetical protein